MHEQLGDVGAEGLVLLRCGNQLHGSLQAALRFRHEDHPLATGMTQQGPLPPGLRFRSRHGPHEVHRSPTLDRIDENIDECSVPRLRLLRRQDVHGVPDHGTGSTVRMTA
jgi:hypothetical protein